MRAQAFGSHPGSGAASTKSAARCGSDVRGCSLPAVWISLSPQKPARGLRANVGRNHVTACRLAVADFITCPLQRRHQPPAAGAYGSTSSLVPCEIKTRGESGWCVGAMNPGEKPST